ncbi:hypothetical protein SNEBB_002961 [Seison nebaliae]|nr:hypothetical protein SNEBB_002961 [Seison nebaliae]
MKKFLILLICLVYSSSSHFLKYSLHQNKVDEQHPINYKYDMDERFVPKHHLDFMMNSILRSKLAKYNIKFRRDLEQMKYRLDDQLKKEFINWMKVYYQTHHRHSEQEQNPLTEYASAPYRRQLDVLSGLFGSQGKKPSTSTQSFTEGLISNVFGGLFKQLGELIGDELMKLIPEK